MEHKGNKNLNDYLDGDDNGGDFDNLLKEKLKGCTTPSESTILSEQKLVPTKGKLPPAESVVEDSPNTSNSNETSAPEELSEPSSAEPVVVSTSEVEVLVAASELPSDPDYTRQILEGKDAKPRTSLTTIRGIKSGPWAKQNLTEETLPGDEVLEKLGLPNLQKIWSSAHTFMVRECGKDVDKVIKQINRLEVAAFRVNIMKEAQKDYLKTLLEGLSGEERERAETLLSKLYKEKSDRTKPPSAPKAPREQKARELSAALKKQYDGLIDGLGATYDQIIDLMKANPPKDADLVLAYVKTRFNK